MPSDGNQSPPRRTSFTSSTFNSLLGRSNTTASVVSPFPGPITTAAAQDQRRRMSASGTSPTQTSAAFSRRISISTNNSDTIPESAIDDEDGPPASNPTTPFARRMSKAAEEVLNGSTALRKNLGTNGEGFNWSEQIRSRAESNVSAGRPSFSNPSPAVEKSSPPTAIHERAKSVSQLPKQPAPPQTLKERLYSKPDDIGERMLKGDYYY